MKSEKVADIKPAGYNPRTISKEALAALGRALREFGDLGGIVVNVRTGNLISGHQRIKNLEAAWPIIKQEIPDATGQVAAGYIETPWGRLAYREVDWPERKEKAANLAANKHRGDFDMTAVKAILAELDDGRFDLDLTGFLPDERFTLMGHDKDARQDEDEVPASMPGAAEAKRGDLYILGQHRVLCGDATDPTAVDRLFAGERAACVFTDPPYGVSYAGNTKPWDVIKGDTKQGDDLMAMLVGAFKNAVRIVTEKAAFYIWHPSATREDFAAAMKAAGLIERQYIIWAKPGITLGHADYNWAHEPCFYAVKQGDSPAFYGDRTQSTIWRAAWQTKAAILQGPDTASTVWEIGRDHGYKHPTQKPVELARRAMANSTKAGDIVADLFLGSGSTLIAAEVMGRRCFGTELDPAYVDIIVKRWENFTGKKAERRTA